MRTFHLLRSGAKIIFALLMVTSCHQSGTYSKKMMEGNRYMSDKKADMAEDDIYDERESVLAPLNISQNEKEKPSSEFNTESYNTINENKFLSSAENPLSTFSIDVDNASYTNSRRYIESGNMPPKDAVRIEEFINYFSYNYPQPKSEHPFSFFSEVGACPWNNEHKLIHIGIQGNKIPFEQMPALNLCFLIDVSGSMVDANKLPLLKKSFEMLTMKLRPQDHISIAVYAGAAGLILPPTPGSEKQKILKALDKLEAGGSTAGGEGIKLAYNTLKENLSASGINRVILATDGDFNIGVSSDAEMTRLIEEKRESGIFLTVLGFGMGNYKDSKMETIADNGNGNYFYIDDIAEAQKVLVTEIDGTLNAIAKDVKIQIEFNPTKVKEYRLIGYENRMLKKEDFNDDKKDAGELGAGHTVTAIYEIVPGESKEINSGKSDNLKYQNTQVNQNASQTDELLTIKFRYKKPKEDNSNLIEHTIKDNNKTFDLCSEEFRFSASVAGFALILRESEFKGNLNYNKVIEMANNSKGADEEGYRAEFIKLVKTSESISGLAQK